MSDDPKPTLLDPEAMGGDTAEGGFGYQAQAVLARIPVWLGCDGFTDMLKEGFGDAEARFFLPGVGLAREFVEYKNHPMAPAEFWGEISRFRQMDEAYSGCYWRFTLVCNGVSATIQPLLNALRRVRDAVPFYSDAPPITEASFAAFADVARRLGQDEATALFLFRKVFVDTDPPRTLALGFAAFRDALERHFPTFCDLAQGHAMAAYQALSTLLSSARSTPVSRADLTVALWSGVPVEKRPVMPIRVTTASEPLLEGWELPTAIVFDWSDFSGGNDRRFPGPEDWERRVVAPLRATKAWIEESGRKRRILLSGRRRLSASLAIGSVFNAVSGFAIDVEIGENIWSTDDHATPDAPTYEWKVETPAALPASELAVAIGIGRDAGPDVRTYLASSYKAVPLLVLAGDAPLTSAQHTNNAVRGAKHAIADVVAATRATTIHLFIAGPAQFAVFLGHRLNSMGVVQCYERTEPGMYVLTCLILSR